MPGLHNTKRFINITGTPLNVAYIKKTVKHN